MCSWEVYNVLFYVKSIGDIWFVGCFLEGLLREVVKRGFTVHNVVSHSPTIYYTCISGVCIWLYGREDSIRVFA